VSEVSIIECKEIFKSFGSTKALKGVSLSIGAGEIRGLIGENGSGKSTLSSIIAGIQPCDSGAMSVKGEDYSPKSSLEAEKFGIGMIVQEKGTLDNMTVAANIFLGRERQFTKSGIFSKPKMNKAAQELLNSLGLEYINAKSNISWLNPEMRKLVEIARVMYAEPDVLIVDETTTALSQTGRDIIYSIMRKQAEDNKAVIFITHDLDELMDICTSITVLRDGEYIDTVDKENTSVSALRDMMVGREFDGDYYRSDYDSSCCDELALTLENVSDSHMISNFSLELHKGEILGIAGLSECGMHEIGRLAYGITPTLTGKVVNHFTNTEIKNCYSAKKSKMGYISKNRDTEAIILNASIQENILMPSYDLISKAKLVSSRDEKTFAEREANKLKIKCSSLSQYADELSGGNKQKIVFAKWIGNGSDIFIMDCPTRGIDIGVKASMYQLMYALKKEGKAILLISEELTEVIGMSDRILVIKDGKITAEVKREEMPTEKQLVHHMI